MADTIESIDVPGVHGLVALNPDGSTFGGTPGGATAAKQDELLTELQLKADLTETQPVSLTTLPTGTNTIGAVEMDCTAISNGQVSVDTTSGGVTILAASAGRQGVLIKNQGAVTCYIGTGTVTTANGMELKAGESMSLPTDSDVKGITASSSTTISYLSFA